MQQSDEWNVRAAGARGDGRHDDTEDFQRLIDRAAACQATVMVPPGVYCVGRLRLRPNVGLMGHPTYSWKGSGGAVLQLADAAAGCLLDLTGALGARVDGLCLDGMKLGRGVHGILNEGSYGYSAQPNWSPAYGLILERLRNVVIQANVLDAGAVRELILDSGGHGPGVIIKDNPGDVFAPG